MKIRVLKKLQLITVLLFILTILIMIIGLMLINFSYIHYCINNHWKYANGFSEINHWNISFIINNSWTKDIHKENYYPWIQLQIGVIFFVILVPILLSTTISLTSFVMGLKIKIKNNNFWDAIQNCEIINNYYIHIKTMFLNLSYYI